MSKVRELAPGLLEIETNKHIDKLRRDETVLAVYELEDTHKAIVDISTYMESVNYIH